MPKFLDVNPAAPRTFIEPDGKSFLPIGCNICFVRDAEKLSEQEVYQIYRKWLEKFAANGGNFARIWVGSPFFDVMPEKAGVMSERNLEHIRTIVRYAEELNIKLKFTLEQFRHPTPAPRRPDGQFDEPLFHAPVYAPYAKTMKEYCESAECRKLYLAKAKYIADAVGNSPALVAIDLWNEIDAIGPLDGYAGEWSSYMIPELQKIFPCQMILQNLGSYASLYSTIPYHEEMRTPGNGFLQIHRYLDPGAQMAVCQAPMDVICADSIKIMRNSDTVLPVILAETGAVKPNHTGPSTLYDVDKEGTLLHDALFAPFFAGSAGCGQFWYWDCYIDRLDLWYHFKRFAEAVKGLDPAVENFRPEVIETAELRIYALYGNMHDLFWLRDKRNNWQSELVERKPAELTTSFYMPLECRGEGDFYFPWEERHEKAAFKDGFCKIPAFRRSLVLRIAHNSESKNASADVRAAVKMEQSSYDCGDPKVTPYETMFPQEVYTLANLGRYPRRFYPDCSDRAAWEKPFANSPEKAAWKATLLAKAETVLATPMPVLRMTDYLAYRREGNRTRFETYNFRRRDSLGILVMALGVTGDKEKYLPAIVDHLAAICEESFWCLHAHALYWNKTDCFPDAKVTRRLVDLFAAETASLIALTMNVCESALLEYSPNFTAEVKRIALERTVLSVLDPEINTDFHGWRWGVNNWSVWITDNMLISGAVLLDDPKQFAALLKKLNRVIGLYLWRIADDGYCDEGPAYWRKAGAELMQCTYRLEQLFPGSMRSVHAMDKFRAVTGFPAKVLYSEDYFVNFADASSRIVYDPGAIYPAAKASKSAPMRDLAAYHYGIWLKRELTPLKPIEPGKAIRGHFENGDFLRQRLAFIFDVPDDFRAGEGVELNDFVFYPGRLVIGRTEKRGGFAATLKGGNNMENHNHNDLGHFTLFNGNEPLIIDLGTIIYGKQSFSDHRYELPWYGAAGHNAPFAAGKGQVFGKTYKAELSVVENQPQRKVFRCDLSHAYPAEAKITSLVRTVTLEQGRCVLADKAGQGTPLPLEITFYTAVPVAQKGKVLTLGKATEMILPADAAVTVEPFPCDDRNICNSWGKGTLSKIKVRINAPEYSIEFRKR